MLEGPNYIEKARSTTMDLYRRSADRRRLSSASAKLFAVTQAATPPKTVLIAAQTAAVRERFGAALQGAGNRAIGVDAAEGLFARLQPPAGRVDLVMIDLRLQPPGVQTVRTIRQLDADVPIIIFSGSIDSAAEVLALSELGITRYINEHCAVQQILPSLAPQLYPDSFNRRTSVRVTLGIPIALRFGDSIAAALTLNLGKGGVGVRTMSPLDAGTKVSVRFRLPASQREIDAASRVAWSDRRSGMGLQFEEVETPDQSAVDEFVDQQFFGGPPD